MNFHYRRARVTKNGAVGRIRTPDHRFRRPVLYPLSYDRNHRNWDALDTKTLLKTKLPK